MLLRTAKMCKRQGNHATACKLYTQGGDKIKAFKCMLKSSD